MVAVQSKQGRGVSWRVLAAAALLSGAGPALAQASDASLGRAIEGWRERHGSTWRVEIDPGTSAVEFLWGYHAKAPFTPRSDEEWFQLARWALGESLTLHGIEGSTLIEDRALFLPLGMVGSSDKVTVRFRQAVDGVPVEWGSVNVLFDSHGRLLAIQTRALPGVETVSVTPTLSAQSALQICARRFRSETGVDGGLDHEPALVIAQHSTGERREARLAYRVTLSWEQTGFEPEGYSYLVDAHTGEVFERERSIHNLDVGGTVTTKATPGVAPDSATNPETVQPLAYARVQSSAGTVFTDANGNFNFPGVSGPLSCTFTYVGTFNNVVNAAGPAYSIATGLTGTGNSVLLNQFDDNLTTAQANAFIGVNDIRDWIRSVNPFDSTADFVHVANCNLNSSCNAFFNGNSINFYIESGGCPSTAYSTVVAHEDGHWLNVLYGIGNNSDGMGEGSADSFALHLYNDRYVARDFFGPGLHLRDGENLRQFCGDCCPSCYGGFHNDGEVFMGANWKVRNELIATLGPAAGDALVDALFLGWHNAYDQATIKSVIEAQWLTLDDTDGNINNGTPHFTSIDNGFRAQGFPGVAFVPINLDLPLVADTSDEVGPYQVTLTATSNLSASITSATLNYRVGSSGSFSAVAMSPGAGATWLGSIPGTPSPARVFYYAQVTDSFGNTAFDPPLAGASPRFFSIGSSQVLFADDFETAKGWSSPAAVNVGAWVRDDPIGTSVGPAQAQPEDDSPFGVGSQCFFTGQGTVGGNADQNDVDNGPRTLTSPPFDIPYPNAELRYAYWLFSSAQNDSLRVELSLDGIQWVTARTHTVANGGWREDRIDIGSHVTTGSTVRVRFSISDTPNDSITEAAIDDVVLSTLLSSGCSLPTVYCTAKLDSTFCYPQASYQGYPSIGGTSPLQLQLSGASGQRNGLLFYGYGVQATPYLGGYFCATTPVRRTPIQSTGATAGSCLGSMSFDFGALIASGVDPQLTVGRLCAAQWYYRDPQDPFGTCLSNAVSFTICP